MADRSEERLTTVPTERDASPEWTRAFREVDPRTELIYIGKGKWWVGIVYENIALIEIGRLELEQIKKAGGASWATERLALLKAAGFRRVILWDVGSDGEWVSITTPGGENGWGRMLEQYRLQNEVYLKHPDSDAGWQRLYMRHRMGHTDGKLERAIARILDLLHGQKDSIIGKLKGRKIFTGLGGILKPRAD